MDKNGESQARLTWGAALLTILTGHEEQLFKLAASVIALMDTFTELHPGSAEKLQRSLDFATEHPAAQPGKEVIAAFKRSLEELETELIRLKSGGKLQ